MDDMTTKPANTNLNAPEWRAGYQAVPLQSPGDWAAPCLCVVVSLQPQPHFIALGDSLDGVACLGCLVDGDKSVLEWLELRAQFVSGLGAAALRQHHFIDNDSLDR